jgi:5-methylcytosine-specific restriction enzyme subunit McrC
LINPKVILAFIQFKIMSNNSLTIFEYDAVYDARDTNENLDRCYKVDTNVYEWLKKLCLGDQNNNQKGISWLVLRRKNNQEVIQFSGYVGVLHHANTGFQLEILPKTGLYDNNIERTRKLLIDMLRSLPDFKHFKSSDAEIEKTTMPLLEVFIRQFLLATDAVVKRGLRSEYVSNQDNLFALRGKLIFSQHVKQNLVRRDRFYTEHDEFLQNRPENRLIHTSLKRVLRYTRSSDNQKLARELGFVFNDIPESHHIELDFQKVQRLDRGMSYYQPALAWSKLILNSLSPLTGSGKNNAISLLFPMADVFEAYVAKHLAPKFKNEWHLKKQVKSEYLVNHKNQKWFQLKPDILITKKGHNEFVMDTKWKLLDRSKNNGTDKYDLSQADFYQLYAYGHYYLNQEYKSVFLIYPKTEKFEKALEFSFNSSSNFKLGVLPFDLEKKELIDFDKRLIE